jgi:hypothetical protein
MPKTRIGVLLATFLSLVVSLTFSAQPALAQLQSFDAPNAFETDCNGVNNNGIVVGFATDATTFLNRGFFIQGGRFHMVDVGVNGTVLYGINNNNQAVGWYTDSTGTAHGMVVDQQRHLKTIDPPGSVATNAWSINDAGVIVGAYQDSGGVFHGFSLTGSTYKTFDAPNGSILTETLGINNKNEMVGIFDDSAGVEHGFGVKGSTFIQIDNPASGGVVTATDRINDSEEYVGLWGTSTSGPFSGYHAKNNHFVTITFPGSFETRTRGLNNSGVVAGRYTDQNGVIHGYAGLPQ